MGEVMSIKINLNIFLFVILFILTNQIEIYSLVMLFALIHELGHLLCGVLLGFEAECLRIMPLGFSIHFKTNIDDYNIKIGKSNFLTIKKLFINIAGPITNLIIILIGYLMKWNSNILYANLIIFIINMIPIYPLDGGRIVKNVLKILIGNRKSREYANKISNFFVIVITVISSIAVYYYQNIAIVLALIFLWTLIINENKRYRTYSKIYKAIDKEKNYI